MKSVTFLVLLTLSQNLLASTSAKLFHIERSKNKNEVHYELLLANGCKPKEVEPVHGFWKELEKGPEVTSEINTFEYMAYGVMEQKIVGDWVNFKMKALPDKDFKARVIKDASGNCQAEAMTHVNSKETILEKIFIFSVDGMIRPKVKYIDLFGKLPDGTENKERLTF